MNHMYSHATGRYNPLRDGFSIPNATVQYTHN